MPRNQYVVYILSISFFYLLLLLHTFLEPPRISLSYLSQTKSFTFCSYEVFYQSTKTWSYHDDSHDRRFIAFVFHQRNLCLILYESLSFFKFLIHSFQNFTLYKNCTAINSYINVNLSRLIHEFFLLLLAFF